MRSDFQSFERILRNNYYLQDMNADKKNENKIWTIGHSTRTLEAFINLLKEFKIELLADIRSYPGSRRFPHFNKDALKNSLQENNIEYIHLPK
jgi:hypothetical protein